MCTVPALRCRPPWLKDSRCLTVVRRILAATTRSTTGAAHSAAAFLHKKLREQFTKIAGRGTARLEAPYNAGRTIRQGNVSINR
jgi:hypothetical protein